MARLKVMDLYLRNIYVSRTPEVLSIQHDNIHVPQKTEITQFQPEAALNELRQRFTYCKSTIFRMQLNFANFAVRQHLNMFI